jgi:hypothetical protein
VSSTNQYCCGLVDPTLAKAKEAKVRIKGLHIGTKEGIASSVVGTLSVAISGESSPWRASIVGCYWSVVMSVACITVATADTYET